MKGPNNFEYTSKLKNTFLAVLVIGVILTVIGIFTADSMDRFWANFLLDTVYFLGIAVVAVFFIAAHQIAMSGWHITIKRIPEAMSQFAKFGAVGMLVIILGVGFGYHQLYHHWNNDFIKEKTVTLAELDEYNAELAEEGKTENEPLIFHRTWQEFQYNQYRSDEAINEASHEEHMALVADEKGEVENPYFDKIIDGKKGYLNTTFWTIRSIIYLIVWVWIAIMLRKFSIQEDTLGTTKWFMKSKFWAAIFLPIWGVTSSMMAWDWLMSLDPHWYSTLFGWYVFVSLWVACVCVILLLAIYLKRRGYLPQLNENHLHDLGKYVFAFSIFWTYLWFSQFMLYWYGNIPEETKWFLERARTNYRLIFYANLIVNFLFPFLMFMRRDAKRDLNVLMIVASVLVVSHWLDFFMIIMPTTLGENWGIGLLEVGLFFTYAGLFLYVVFGELAKVSLVPANHPMYKESLDHHI